MTVQTSTGYQRGSSLPSYKDTLVKLFGVGQPGRTSYLMAIIEAFGWASKMDECESVIEEESPYDIIFLSGVDWAAVLVR